MPKFPKEIIVAAIAGFEAQKQNIDAQIAELRSTLTGPVAASGSPKRRGRAESHVSRNSLYHLEI